ncbi:MAG TPA: hypothetical protein VML75_16410 [Kofleriaceae bacterium]|nr:hypothetical protein [Kofleriaceae bacterium]
MGDPSNEDLVHEFKEYLDRYDAISDTPIDFGGFIKHNGRLVRKLRYDEFEPVFREYTEVSKAYFDSVDRGDTINDVVVKLIRDRATELMKTSPV